MFNVIFTLIDFFVSLFVFAWIVAFLTGSANGGGFSISGLPVSIVLIIALAYAGFMSRFRSKIWGYILSVLINLFDKNK